MSDYQSRRSSPRSPHLCSRATRPSSDIHIHIVVSGRRIIPYTSPEHSGGVMSRDGASGSSEGPWIWEFHTARTQNSLMPSMSPPLSQPKSPVRARKEPKPSPPSSSPRPRVILRSTISPPHDNTPRTLESRKHPILSNEHIPTPPAQSPSPNPHITTTSTTHPRLSHPPITSPSNMYIPSLLPPITTPSSIHPSIAYSSATPSLAVSPITAPPPAEQPIESLETSTERRTRKQLDVYTRTQICTLKNIAGWSYSQIQAHFPHIPRSTITTTVKREPSRRNNQTVRRTGAPKKLGEEEKKKLLDALDNDPRITWDDLEKVIDRKAGRHCIRRLFESEGRRKGPPDRKLRHSQKMMAGARGSESDSGPDPNIRPEPDT